MLRRDAGAALYRTHYRYSWEQAVAALERAEREDIACGGIYDTPGEAVIRIWSTSTTMVQGRDVRDLIGAIYWDWGLPSTQCIEVFALHVGPGATLSAVKEHVQKLFGTPLRHTSAA
jgi:hypothetical protein